MTDQDIINNIYIIVPAQFVFTAIRLYSYRFVAAHSDGGGWDSGTSHSFHPKMKYEHSIRGEMITFTHKRGTIILWSLYWMLNLIPGYVLFSACTWFILFVLPFLCWLLFPYDENMPHSYHN